MSAAQVIGALLIALPFVAVAVFVVREMGWGSLLVVFGSTALVVGCIFAGYYLMTGSLS